MEAPRRKAPKKPKEEVLQTFSMRLPYDDYYTIKANLKHLYGVSVATWIIQKIREALVTGNYFTPQKIRKEIAKQMAEFNKEYGSARMVNAPEEGLTESKEFTTKPKNK